MDHNNSRRLYIPLYCDQSTQTQPESDCEADSSDFPPFKVGKSMSPASAMCRNPPSDKETRQPHHHQHNTGLGQINVVNVVNTTSLAQHRKVICVLRHSSEAIMLIVNVNTRLFVLFRPNPRQTLPMNACRKNGVYLLMMRTA